MADSHYDVEQTNTNVEAETVLPVLPAPQGDEVAQRGTSTESTQEMDSTATSFQEETTPEKQAHREKSRRAFSLFGDLDPDVQRAEVSKRLYAGLVDFMLLAILTVACVLALGAIINMPKYYNRYVEIIDRYEADYGVTFGMTQAEYKELTEEEQANYKAAVDAVNADEELKSLTRTGFTLIFVIIIGSILFAMLILEFVVPLLFKDGRTLGKKIFGLGVMRNNLTHVKPFVLFARNIIGKGVMELALPAAAVISVILGLTGWFGIVLLVLFAVMEIVVFAKSHGSALLHDTLADTVVIDWASQRMFDTQEEARAFYEARRAEQRQQEEKELF
jgi:uncharacterized RDD family membrane protein YckC